METLRALHGPSEAKAKRGEAERCQECETEKRDKLHIDNVVTRGGREDQEQQGLYPGHTAPPSTFPPAIVQRGTGLPTHSGGSPRRGLR